MSLFDWYLVLVLIKTILCIPFAWTCGRIGIQYNEKANVEPGTLGFYFMVGGIWIILMVFFAISLLLTAWAVLIAERLKFFTVYPQESTIKWATAMSRRRRGLPPK